MAIDSIDQLRWRLLSDQVAGDAAMSSLVPARFVRAVPIPPGRPGRAGSLDTTLLESASVTNELIHHHLPDPPEAPSTTDAPIGARTTSRIYGAQIVSQPGCR